MTLMTTATESAKLTEITELLAKGTAPDVAMGRALWLQCAAQWSAFSDAERAAAPELRQSWQEIGTAQSWI
jgi:hypothetical protein